MGSNCNGVEVGLNKYPMVWNLPSLHSVQLGSMTGHNNTKVKTPQLKVIERRAETIDYSINKTLFLFLGGLLFAASVLWLL